MGADGLQVQDQLVEHSGTCLKVKKKFDKKNKIVALWSWADLKDHGNSDVIHILSRVINQLCSVQLL